MFEHGTVKAATDWLCGLSGFEFVMLQLVSGALGIGAGALVALGLCELADRGWL